MFDTKLIQKDLQDVLAKVATLDKETCIRVP